MDEVQLLTCSDEVYGTQSVGFTKSLHNRTLFSDVTLVIGNERIPSHRVILAIWSPVLREGLMNSYSNEFEIEQKDSKYTPTNIRRMISFLYTGEVEAMKQNETLDLLALANEFQIEALKNACGESLADSSTHENLSYLLDIAEKFQCAALKNRCGKFMAEHFSDLLESNQLMKADPQIWKGILMSEKVKVKSEEVLFEHMLQFTSQFDAKTEAELLRELLPHIHFSQMTPKYLVTNVDANPKLKNDPSVHQCLYQVFRDLAWSDKNSTTNVKRRQYDRVNFIWVTKGVQMVISNNSKTASTTVAWNQVQADQPLICGTYFEVKIEEMCSASVNSYGIVVGVGPTNIVLNGPTAIIGYSGQAGCGYVGGNGTFFGNYTVKQSGSASKTFQSGDVIKVEWGTDGVLSFYRNNDFIQSYVVPTNQQLYPTVAISSGKVTLL